MQAALGTPESHWTLKVAIPDQEPREFKDLKCDPEWKQARWIGFSSLADHRVSFYLDDLAMSASK
jgi:hypothetical protein